MSAHPIADRLTGNRMMPCWRSPNAQGARSRRRANTFKPEILRSVIAAFDLEAVAAALTALAALTWRFFSAFVPDAWEEDDFCGTAGAVPRYATAAPLLLPEC